MRRQEAVRIEKGADGSVNLGLSGSMALLRKIAEHESESTGYRITLGAVLRKLIRQEAKRLGIGSTP